MATVKWAASPTSRGTVLTTELNTLANGAYSAAGPTYDNTTNLDEWFWFEFVGGGSITPTAGAYLQIYAVPSLDGTNFADAASSTQVGWQQLVATISIKTGAHAVRDMTLFPVQLPPGKFKFVAKNGTGVALTATSNVVNLYTANESVA